MPGDKPKLLVVDDEPQIRELLSELLSEQFETVTAADGLSGIALARQEKPALVIMDIMMPGMSGIEACEKLRNDPATRHIPVMMLSAASQKDNRVKAFDLGADDFIPKPFDVDELIARVWAKLRRSREARYRRTTWDTFENLSIDERNLTASIDGTELRLSSTEFQLIKLLMSRPNEVVRRHEILKKIWGEDADLSDRLIDAHMVALRKKLVGFKGQLKTVYGAGYSLRESKND